MRVIFVGFFLTIIFLTLTFTVNAQSEIEFAKGSGTYDAQGGWDLKTVDLTGYQSGKIRLVVNLGKSRCSGAWGIYEDGSFNANTKPTITHTYPNRGGQLFKGFTKPTKFILAVKRSVGFCGEGTGGTFEYVIYLSNWKKGNNADDCINLPPISFILSQNIEKLKTAAKYSERSQIYKRIHEELQKRGVGIGFFGAASAVTSDFSDDPFGIIKIELSGINRKAEIFLDDLSKELAVLNTKYAIELLETGRLKKENENSYFFNPKEIDEELVRREQKYAEKKLAADPNRKEIVEIINGITNAWGTKKGGSFFGFSSIIATNEVRNNKRKKDPSAEFDYGNITDRMNVGKTLADQNRSNIEPKTFCEASNSPQIDSSCRIESTLSSKESAAPRETAFTLVNQSKVPIVLYWLNYQGQRVKYAEIAPNDRFEQPTYLLHPWVVTDSSGKCLRTLEAPGNFLIK